MDITSFLAKVMGLYFIAISVWLLLNLSSVEKTVKDFLKNRPLVLVSEVITLLLGIVLVVAHTRVGSPEAILVTLIGWGITVKGVFWMLASERSEGTMLVLNKKSLHAFSAVVGLFLGLYLAYAGLFM